MKEDGIYKQQVPKPQWETTKKDARKKTEAFPRLYYSEMS